MKNNENRQTFFTLLSTVILYGINFVTMPIFAELLGAEQYAYYSIFSTWVTIFVPILGLETGSSLSVAIYDYKENYDNYKKDILLLGSLSSLTFIVIGYCLRNLLSSMLGFPQELIVVMFSFSFATYVCNLVNNILIYEKKANINFVFSLLITISTTVLSYTFIKNNYFTDKYVGRVYGNFIPYLFISIIAWIIIFRKGNRKVDIKHWKYALSYGLPIVFHLLSHEALGQSNKLMLQYMGYAGTTVGIYSFFSNFSSIMSIIVTSFNSSWVPFYNDYLNDNDREKLKTKTHNYMELITILFTGFILLSREVCEFMADEEYMVGVNILPLQIIPVFLMYMYQFPVNFEFYCKKTKLIPIGTICSGIANILGNLLFIPKYGMYGSILSTIISYLVLFITHFINAKLIKDYQFNLRLLDYLPWIIMFSISIALFYVFDRIWIIRWITGAILGVYELLQIKKRKSIF